MGCQNTTFRYSKCYINLIIKIALSYTFPTCLGLKTKDEPRNDQRTPKLEKITFLKLAVFFPSLIPSPISPTDDRENSERTPTQLPAHKKCCFLRLLPNKVVLIPKKVDSFPEIVDLSISQQNRPFYPNF